MADLPVRVTGRPLPWARDLAVVTGVSAYLAPLLVWGWSSLSIAAGVGGVLTGALIGITAPWILDRVRGRVPLALLATMGIGLGALWGGALGTLATAIQPTILAPSTTIMAAALVGAVQLGLFWFPYTFLTVVRSRTWPMIMATCALAPVTGWLVFSLFL